MLSVEDLFINSSNIPVHLNLNIYQLIRSIAKKLKINHKGEKETYRISKEVVPYDPNLYMERVGEIKNKSFYYYQWDKINIEKMLALEESQCREPFGHCGPSGETA